MNLKCSDGKVRKFLVCRPRTISTRFGDVEVGGLLEAECVECKETFGCHDTYILKQKFLDHVCATQQSAHLTLFPACKTCEYNPCDLANNFDYCPARVTKR